MSDIYSDHGVDLGAPASGAFAISPSDATIFSQPTRALYVGSSGTLEVEMLWGGTVSFEGVPGGTILPVRAVKVKSGTTAGFILGLY